MNARRVDVYDSLRRSEEARVFEERACGHPRREEATAAVASELAPTGVADSYRKKGLRLPHVPRGFARCVARAVHGSSGQGCLG